MTPAQRKWLERADKHGNIAYRGQRGYGRRAWERCMEAAHKQGLVTPNAWGEYTITDAGRAAISSGKQG